MTLVSLSHRMLQIKCLSSEGIRKKFPTSSASSTIPGQIIIVITIICLPQKLQTLENCQGWRYEVHGTRRIVP